MPEADATPSPGKSGPSDSRARDPSPALLTELPEAHATGVHAHIYGEIRRWSGVPMVALIFRHLATLPGVLEWAWALIGPAMRAGVLQREAWTLAADATIPARAALVPAALRVAGIDEADESSIAAILDAYNRANPVNILALRCLALHLADPGVAPRAPAELPPGQPPPAPAPIGAMVDPRDMTPAVRALAMLLTNRGAAQAPSPLWPSLYRHLAPWPAYLGYASLLVVPEFSAIDQAAVRFRTRIDAAAEALARRLAAPADAPAPSDAVRSTLQEAIDRFGTRIPEMVVIGGVLRRALPSAADTAARGGP